MLLDSEKDRWLSHTHALDASEGTNLNTLANHIEDGKVGSEERLVQKFGPRKALGSMSYQTHQPVFQSHHHPKKEEDFEYEPSVIKPTNVTNWPRQVHQSQHNHGQRDHGFKQINHGKVVAILSLGNSNKTCWTHQSTTASGGYLNTMGSFTGETWTQLTLLVSILTHTTFTQSNCQFLPQL